jgi:ring-1,2-phenylacetyl-CoA epoxidase subunit PaaB
MIWEVFRQEASDSPPTYVGHVHAPDREKAVQFARIQHGRRNPVESMWVVKQEDVTKITSEDAEFGGVTDKSYRWATTYTDIEPPAESVAQSELEQQKAEKKLEERTDS